MRMWECEVNGEEGEIIATGEEADFLKDLLWVCRSSMEDACPITTGEDVSDTFLLAEAGTDGLIFNELAEAANANRMEFALAE